MPVEYNAQGAVIPKPAAYKKCACCHEDCPIGDFYPAGRKGKKGTIEDGFKPNAMYSCLSSYCKRCTSIMNRKKYIKKKQEEQGPEAEVRSYMSQHHLPMDPAEMTLWDLDGPLPPGHTRCSYYRCRRIFESNEANFPTMYRGLCHVCVKNLLMHPTANDGFEGTTPGAPQTTPKTQEKRGPGRPQKDGDKLDPWKFHELSPEFKAAMIELAEKYREDPDTFENCLQYYDYCLHQRWVELALHDKNGYDLKDYTNFTVNNPDTATYL